MTKQLSADQRGRIAEKVMEWGNLVFVGTAIAQGFYPSNFAEENHEFPNWTT